MNNLAILAKKCYYLAMFEAMLGLFIEPTPAATEA